MQMEQEMGLIYDQCDIRVEFLKQWSKFVPAILSYGGSNSKKNFRKLLKDLDETG